jgi:predicted component of type VI protein secretion system
VANDKSIERNVTKIGGISQQIESFEPSLCRVSTKIDQEQNSQSAVK